MQRTSNLCVLFLVAVFALWSGCRLLHAEDAEQQPSKKPQEKNAERPMRKTILVYQLEADQDISKDSMNQLVEALTRRLRVCNIDGFVRSLKDNRIEVVVQTTNEKTLTRLKALLAHPGTLEFAILANKRDHAGLIVQAKDIKRDLHKAGKLVAGWRQTGRDETGQPRTIRQNGEIVVRQSKQSKGEEFLIVFEPQRLTGNYLSRVYKTTDENNRPALGFQFNKQGGELLRKLTSANLPSKNGFARRLAILFDGRVYSALHSSHNC